MSTPTAPARLGCGRELAPLVEQVADGLPPADPEHQAGCPFCQEALVRLRGAFAALHDLAGQAVVPPRGLSGRVLAQLRRERHSVVVADGVGGRDTVSEAIVAQVARRAALVVDPVRHASAVCEALQDGSVALEIHLTAALGPALPDVVAAVREQVIAELWALCGVRASSVDVTVDDVV